MTSRYSQQQQLQLQQQQQQPQQVNYGSYSRIGELSPGDKSMLNSRHRQSQGGIIAVIILLVIIGLLCIGTLIAASIAATEAKKCKHHHHAHPRVHVEWDLASGDSCDDMNPCTVDFADHADDPRKTVCMNHPRPNGYPCNSTCFFKEHKGGTHKCKNLGKGCAECRGTRCKGECRRDRDCPTRRGRGPLLRIPQRSSCNDGICVWEFFEERSRFNFPCDVDVLRKRCLRFVKPEFRECMDAEPTCGVQFGGRGGKKGGQRDELPMLPMPSEETERDSDGKHGGNGDAGPQLTRCSFSFKCARPSEPYIPKPPKKHGEGEHPVAKEQPETTTTTESSFGTLDSFLEDTDQTAAAIDTTLEDFKKLTKKSSISHRQTTGSRRAQRHTIEGSAAKRL